MRTDVSASLAQAPPRAVQHHVEGAASGVIVANTPEELLAIRDPRCAAVIFERRQDPSLQAWIDGLLPQTLPRGRMALSVEDVRAAVVDLCHRYGTPENAMHEALADDIAALAAVFAKVMDVAFLTLRLEAVSSNACSKFHVDAIKARLICTYRGTGTQYGNARDGHGPTPIFTVPTGAPIVLRGTLWPQPTLGLVHRSPPIAGTGETRLVLVLDPD